MNIVGSYVLLGLIFLLLYVGWQKYKIRKFEARMELDEDGIPEDEWSKGNPNDPVSENAKPLMYDSTKNTWE